MSETSSNAIPAYLPLRNDLIGEEPYGAPQLDVPVCLNVNENPYAPEPAVVETIAQRVKEIAPTLNRYPDREHIELRKAFSTYLERESGVKLSVDQLWGANGSNEIMLQLFQAFGGPGRIALGCDPTYSMYPEYARDTFTTWKLAHRNADFTLDVDATIKAIEDVKPAMIVLTSPNNPTGTPLKPEDLKRVLEAARTAEVAGAAEGVHPVVVVDEAYIEFRDPGTPTALELIGEYENLAVSRTMSKAFAFAGARVGYLAANKGIIDCVRIVRHAVPPVRRHPGRRPRRVRTHRRTAEPRGAPARNPQRHLRMAQGADLQGPAARSGRNPVELHSLRRPFRRPRPHLRRTVEARRAHPRRRSGRLDASVHGHRRGNGTVP